LGEPRAGQGDNHTNHRRESAVDSTCDRTSADVAGQADRILGGPARDDDLRPTSDGCLGGEPTHAAGPDDEDRLVLEGSGPLLDLVQRGIAQRPLRPAEPFVRAASGGQRDLEETVQHRVQGPLAVTQGEGLADLVEDLVLAQDGALKAAGDADEVACRRGVLQPQPSGRQLREL
jgi:hypothetical protein